MFRPGFLVFLSLAFLAMVHLTRVKGHGFLVDPPQRSSMWRKGFDVPINYDDMALNCGGRETQWMQFGGKCGTCGDPYGGPIQNDDGGKYDTGTIGRTYTQGSFIDVAVDLTANHLGYFTFRLCENGNLHLDQLQECLNQTVLKVVTTSGLADRYIIGPDVKMYTMGVKLPNDITCTHCVLQWDYRTGNNWGRDKTGSGMGYGNQEHFINCADIKILPGDGTVTSTTTSTSATPSTTTTSSTTTESTTLSSTGTTPRDTGPTSTVFNSGSGCKATGAYKQVPGLEKWCVDNCKRGYCPASHCLCSEPDR